MTARHICDCLVSGTVCGDYTIVTAIYIVNAVFLTMFMLANLMDIAAIEDEDEEELGPLVPSGEQRNEKATPAADAVACFKTPSPEVRDLYLTGIGQ